MSTQINSPVKSNNLLNIVLWSLQVLLALVFLMAGGNKLAGAPMMVHVFEAIGVGQWFRYLTGGIEVISALLLLMPGWSGVGALLLFGVMIGAVLTHLLIIGGNPTPAAIFLILTAIVAYGRRRHILCLLGRK